MIPLVVVPESIPKDCTELKAENNTLKSGPYNISPDGKVVISAYCEMTSEGGWTVNTLKSLIGQRN